MVTLRNAPMMLHYRCQLCAYPSQHPLGATSAKSYLLSADNLLTRAHLCLQALRECSVGQVRLRIANAVRAVGAVCRRPRLESPHHNLRGGGRGVGGFGQTGRGV